jgi:cell division protein FtsN
MSTRKSGGKAPQGPRPAQGQRGGFFLGMIVGLLLGLALALGVALYVTKVPVPFVNKVPQRSAEQDAAESERNRNWDPNAPLSGKRAAPVASGTVTPAPAPAPAMPPAPAPAPAATPAPAPAAKASAPAAAASKADAKDAKAEAQFFVQVGAYNSQAEADQQRAKLAISGSEARITEREQDGKVFFRVRLGPFDTREQAEAVRGQVAGGGYPGAAVVRVAR